VQAVIEQAAAPSFRVRWRAARVLGRYPKDENARAVLIKLLDDPHPVVRNMAVLNVAGIYRTNTRWIGSEQLDMVRGLADRFARYGAQCTDDGASWAWRCLGEALLNLGPRGEEALRAFLAQDTDEVLAERAWDVLYVKLNTYKFLKTTAKEAAQGYRQHPRFRPAAPSQPGTLSEPQMMPYLIQDFQQRPSPKDADSPFSDGRHQSGRWNTFSKDFPDVRIAKAKQADTDNQYARLIRRCGLLEGSRIDYLLAAGKARIRFDLLRESSDSDLGVLFTCVADRWRGSTVQIQVDGKGTLKYMDTERRWHATSVTVQTGEWVTLGIDVNLDAQTYDVSLKSADTDVTRAADRVEYRSDHPLSQLIFYPNAPDQNMTGIDNVAITVTNPACARAATP